MIRFTPSLSTWALKLMRSANLVPIPDLGAFAYLAVQSHFLQRYRDCFRIVMSKFFTIERYIAQTPMP
jgi:hypothetical protein